MSCPVGVATLFRYPLFLLGQSFIYTEGAGVYLFVCIFSAVCESGRLKLFFIRTSEGKQDVVGCVAEEGRWRYLVMISRFMQQQSPCLHLNARRDDLDETQG